MSYYGTRLVGDDARAFAWQEAKFEPQLQGEDSDATSISSSAESIDDNGELVKNSQPTLIDIFMAHDEDYKKIGSDKQKQIVNSVPNTLKPEWDGEIDIDVRDQIVLRREILDDLVEMLTLRDPETGKLKKNKEAADYAYKYLHDLTQELNSGTATDPVMRKTVQAQSLFNLIKSSIADQTKLSEFITDKDSLSPSELLNKYLGDSTIYDVVIKNLMQERKALQKIEAEAPIDRSSAGWKRASNVVSGVIGSGAGVISDLQPFAMGLGTAQFISSYFVKPESWINNMGFFKMKDAYFVAKLADKTRIGAMLSKGVLGRFVGGGLLGCNLLGAAAIYGGGYLISEYWTNPKFAKSVDSNIGWLGTGAKNFGFSTFQAASRFIT